MSRNELGCLILVGMVILMLIIGRPSRETENTIIAAHKACEAQTGRHCD